jgi:hypothetical protein
MDKQDRVGMRWLQWQSYYHETTFWQFNTLRFLALDTKGFRPRNSSGLCLNYLIHESWFLFDENRISCCCRRKGDHLLTKCHGMSRAVGTAAHQIQSPTSDRMTRRCYWSKRMLAEFKFTPHCHALQHSDINDAGNTQNTSSCFGNLGLRFKISWDVTQIFLGSLHNYLL